MSCLPVFMEKAPEMFKKILVAVSDNSAEAVLASAIEIARKYDAQIFALHVVDTTPTFIGAAEQDFSLLISAMEAAGRKSVERIEQMLTDRGHAAQVRMVTLPLCGWTVGRAIASHAQESGADLVLLGERKAGWSRWFSTDVAAEVRRQTSTPIQIVSREVLLQPVAA